MKGRIGIVLAACVLTFIQIKWTFMLQLGDVSLEMHAQGKASRPAAYRVAVPALVRGIDRLLPDSIHEMIGSVGGPLIALAEPRRPVPGMRPSQYVTLAFVLVVSLVLYARFSATLYAELFPEARGQESRVAILSLVLLFPFVRDGHGYVYDLPFLMMLAALLLTMHRGSMSLYLVLFAVSCLVKETTVLISVAYLGQALRRGNPGRMAAWLSAQLLLFALCYGSLAYVFRENPGHPIKVQWKDHLEYFAHLSVLDLFWILPCLWLIFHRWREKPEFLRGCSLMCLPHYGLYLIGAMPGEMRNFYEVLPLLSMFAIRNIQHAISCKGARGRSVSRDPVGGSEG